MPGSKLTPGWILGVAGVVLAGALMLTESVPSAPLAGADSDVSDQGIEHGLGGRGEAPATQARRESPDRVLRERVWEAEAGTSTRLSMWCDLQPVSARARLFARAHEQACLDASSPELPGEQVGNQLTLGAGVLEGARREDQALTLLVDGYVAVDVTARLEPGVESRIDLTLARSLRVRVVDGDRQPVHQLTLLVATAPISLSQRAILPGVPEAVPTSDRGFGIAVTDSGYAVFQGLPPGPLFLAPGLVDYVVRDPESGSIGADSTDIEVTVGFVYAAAIRILGSGSVALEGQDGMSDDRSGLVLPYVSSLAERTKGAKPFVAVSRGVPVVASARFAEVLRQFVVGGPDSRERQAYTVTMRPYSQVDEAHVVDMTGSAGSAEGQVLIEVVDASGAEVPGHIFLLVGSSGRKATVPVRGNKWVKVPFGKYKVRSVTREPYLPYGDAGTIEIGSDNLLVQLTRRIPYAVGSVMIKPRREDGSVPPYVVVSWQVGDHKLEFRSTRPEVITFAPPRGPLDVTVFSPYYGSGKASVVVGDHPIELPVAIKRDKQEEK